MLHRDLKPQNIFLDARNNVKIGDLGFGRMLGTEAAQLIDVTHAATGERCALSGVGTPLYFSPELCQESPYNDKSDMWAVGCLLYEMAALRPPFTAANQVALACMPVRWSPVPLTPPSEDCAHGAGPGAERVLRRAAISHQQAA